MGGDSDSNDWRRESRAILCRSIATSERFRRMAVGAADFVRTSSGSSLSSSESHASAATAMTSATAGTAAVAAATTTAASAVAAAAAALRLTHLSSPCLRLNIASFLISDSIVNFRRTCVKVCQSVPLVPILTPEMALRTIHLTIERKSVRPSVSYVYKYARAPIRDHH